MPDLKSLIAAKKAEQEKAQSAQNEGTQSEVNTPDNQITEPSKDGEKNLEQEPVKRTFNSPEESKASAGSRVQAKNDPIGASQQFQPEAGANSVGADISGRDWASEVGNSFMRGLGEHVIGGFGDVAQVIGSALPGINMFDGNIISRFLQEKGHDIGKQHEVYMPEELANPEFSIKTLTDPQFWSKHGAEYIPQLAEFIFVSKGAGSLIKKGVQAGAKGALEKGLIKKATGTLKTSKKLASGADEAYEIANSGKGLGKFVRDTGELTSKAGMVVENVGAGAAGNVITGLLNSAEAYNSRKDLTDEQGNALFTKDELSSIAAGTFKNNLMYMGVDILSWGMTYGNAGKILKQTNLMKKGAAAFDASKNLKNISSAFTAKTSPTFRKLISAAGKGVQEGFEETFQETYENWAAMMAESDVMGTPPKYDSFMDFYNSEENEGTKTIAFALGGLGGNVSGLLSSVNKDAERSRQLYDRVENLKTIFDSNDEKGNTLQKYHMRETISDMVLQGKEDLFDTFTENLVKDGVVTDEEVQQMIETIEDYQVLDQQSDVLNVRGKYALFKNHSTEMFFQEKIEEETNKLNESIDLINASSLTEEQKVSEIEKRTRETDVTIKGLAYGVAQSQANKANLILGKAVEKVIEPIIVKDPKTGKDIVATGMKDADFKYYVQKSNEDILKKGNQKEILKDNIEYDGKTSKAASSLSSIGSKARSLFDGLFKSNKDNVDTETEIDNESENDENISPETSSGERPNGTSQNDDTDTGTIQKEENGGNESNETESVDDISDEVTDEELDQVANLQEELDVAQKPKKDESPSQKAEREKTVKDLQKQIDDFAKKAKSKAKDILPDGLNKETVNNIVSKITGKKPLTKKEQAIVDQFKDTFNDAVKSAKSVGKNFQNFVNKQSSENKPAVDEVKKQIKTAYGKAKKNLGNAIKNYKLGNGPDFKESRGGEIEKSGEVSEDVEQTFGEFEYNDPIESPKLEAPIIGRIKNTPSDLDKMVAINQRLNFMFPKADNRVNAYILDNLNKAIGIRGAGFAVSSAIFVNSDKWDQGEVFMHEMAHIFFNFSKESPETQEILKEVIQNKKLMDKLQSSPRQGGYADYILYSFGLDENGNEKIGTFNDVPTQEDLDEYGAVKLPIEEQSHILEEAFTHSLQGPLSKKYNNFFGLRDEQKRIKSTRKWWKMISVRAKNDPDYLRESQELIRKLNNGDKFDVNNMRDYVVMEFLKEVPRLEATEIGFESRSTSFDAATMERKAKIQVRLNKETAAYNAEESKSLFTRKEDLLDQVLDEISDNLENPDNALSMAEKSFQTRTAKASKLINNFVKEYNRAIRLRKTIWGRKGPLFDKKDFRYKMFQLAMNTDNSNDFIDALETSPQADIQAFNKFLELRTPDAKTVLLNSTWTLFSNQRMVNAVKNILSSNPDGSLKYETEEALSKTEQNRVQAMMENIETARGHLQKNDGHLLADQYQEFESIIARIESNEATDEDYINAYKFIAHPSLKTMDILAHGFINVKGTNYNPATVLKSFIDAKRHLGKPNKNGNRYMYGYAFKPLLQALVATNREFTQDSIVENAKGNMVPVRMMNNHMTKELDQMYDSLRPNKQGKVMTKANFIKRYSHITRSERTAKPVPNQFLENFYDSVISGNKPDLVYYTGINDVSSNKANSFEDSTSYEQSFEDFMMYASAANKKTYLANVGVFGDSPRKYFMPTKRLDMSNDINTAAYTIYKNISGDNLSRRQFELAIKDEIKNEREFFEKNGKQLMKIESLKSYFDSNGKLSAEGKKTVNGYVYNQIMNGLFMAEVMSPNITIDNIAKRLKNAGSPVISVNKKLKFEPIFFKDPEGNEASTDGGMFILREDADRWANAGKGVFDLNEGFKFLNYSVEKDNPNFKGKTVLLKGYTTILDADFIKDNPKFKPLYDLMQKRRAKYFSEYAKKNGGAEPSMNFTDGLENSFPIAIPYSAEKTGISKSDKMNEAPFLNELGNPEVIAKAEAFQDSLMYDNKGNFVGVSGYNFGPQQVMDKIVDEVTLPVQQMNSLLVHASSLGHLAEAEAIQELISEMMEGNLSELTDALKSKDIETYRKIVSEEMNKEDMDQVQRFVIERYGILHPRAIEIVSNQLANTIKNKGNKLRVEGTYAHQKSSYGWQLPVDGKIKGSNELNGYTDAVGGGLNRAEIVLPNHLSDSGKIRPRKYYTIDSKAGEMAMAINDNKQYFDSSKTPAENDLIRLKNAAEAEASRLKTPAEPIFKEGKIVGYYVPGETVIATRVPSNGPNFTGVFEVVGFTTGRGNQVQVPTEFTKTIGADLDGDALFVQHKGSNKKMNEVIDRMEKLWLSPEMAPFIQTSMETKKEGDTLKVSVLNSFAQPGYSYKIVDGKIKETHNGTTTDYVQKGNLAFSPSNRRKSYEDSMVAKRNIGTVFNLHRMANTLAAYKATINNSIWVDNVEYKRFEDIGKGNQSRNHKSALVANLILDNLKENAADSLNINEHTVSAFTLMVNLNIPIKDVANLMNAPMVKEYVAIMNENNSAFHGYTPRKEILNSLSKRGVKGKDGVVKYNAKSKGGVVSNPLDSNFFSQDNQSNIINMIMSIDKVNSDLQQVSKIMSGHNGIETNPYLLEKQISEFKRIMSNDDSALNIPSEMASNPDLKRYLKTAEATLEHTKEIDLVYRPAMTKFLQKLATSQGLDLLTDNQIKKYTKSIARFLHSHISGYNTISKEELSTIVDPKNPESVFVSLSDHMAQLKMDGELENNLLLSQGINVKFAGNKPYISMNPSFFDESLNVQEIKRMNKEFSELPSDLQFKLSYYDLTKNGWDSPMSLLPVIDSYLNQQLVSDLNRDFDNKNDQKYGRAEMRELEEILMLRDFNGARNNIPTFQLTFGNKSKIMMDMQKHPEFKKALLNNTPFYFKSRDNKGKRALYKFVGNKLDLFNKPINNEMDRLQELAKGATGLIKTIKPRTPEQLDIDLVTIKSENNPILPSFKKKSDVAIGMEAREEFWEYSSQDVMDQNRFNDAMEFDKFQTADSKAKAYNMYVESKRKANEIYNKSFRGKDFSTYSPEKLMQLYSQYGSKNAYAYAIITTPVVKALAAKISAQQSKLTGRTKGTTDLGNIQTWLMSNNIPSDHPEIQGMVRNMIALEKSFQNEKKKYGEKINKATNALYKEKFGFVFDTYNPIEIIKRFYYSYIHNRKELYDILYGNIVETNQIVHEGKTINEFKLKDEKTIEKLKKDNLISPAEYEFYKTFKEITKELAPETTSDGKRVRRDYIPHVGMGTFESFANRGLLGLLQLSKSDDQRLNNVKLFAKNKEGQQKLISFKEINDIMGIAAGKSKNNFSQIKEFHALKQKAKKLLKEGKNEDGTDIQIEEFEMDSAMSFGIMNRFANSRSVKSSEMPSMDLNHALNTYVHSTLFVNGNENFVGFKSMQGIVDGILALNQDKGFKNAAKYVKINWKDYYLKGKRQELLGKKGDKVVDLITKLNLFWQLGFKATYVLGNVAAGKYHNIKNGSVKEWAAGEKRFWGMDSDSKDPFTIVKRFKRTQKILKNLNFMEINVYDNVSMSSKGRLDNFLGDLALMPMTWSENWIQGVQMIGMLDQSEWNKFDEDGNYKQGEEPINNQRLTMLENEVKKSQGKGYQATDQRLVQQYSLGRMMLQFSRFIPTMVNDRFAKQDIDIYGKEDIGSLRMIFKTVSEVNSMNPKDYIEYRKKLQKESPELARRLDSGLKGLAMSGLIGAYALETNNEFANKTFWDTNYYADLDKIVYKMIPSAVRTTQGMVSSLTGGSGAEE